MLMVDLIYLFKTYLVTIVTSSICPLSLFILTVDIIARIVIRNKKNHKGIQIGVKDRNNCQFADDITLSLCHYMSSNSF